jgi:ribonucleotide reductase beta subunit family protein with ferritin-like domain
MGHLEHMGHSTPDQATIHQIITEAVDIEREFITESLPCNLIGMNATEMTGYIKFVADHLAVSLGVEKIYGVENPFDFMTTISLQGKNNFFECRVSDYQKCGVVQGGAAVHTFSTEVDF